MTMDRIAPFVNSFSFMGGEPTLHPDLPELCEYARHLGKYTLLVSNGVIFSDRLIDQLEGKVDCIKLGMDGVSAGYHDAVRGQGNFDTTMRTWLRLPQRIPTMCKFTLNALNRVQLPLIADFYQGLGAKRLVLNAWLRIGSGASIWNQKFALSMEQLREINEFIFRELKPRYHIFPVSRSCSLDNGCLETPARTYYVTSVGSVSPCIFSGELAIGNIRDPKTDVTQLLARVDRMRGTYQNLHSQKRAGGTREHSDLLQLPVIQPCPH